MTSYLLDSLTTNVHEAVRHGVVACDGMIRNMTEKAVQLTVNRVNVGVQAGTFIPKNIGGYIQNVIGKCVALQDTYSQCNEDLKQGQSQLDQSESHINDLTESMATLGENMDSMGAHILQKNASLAHKSLETDTLRREIAAKEKRLMQLTGGEEHHVIRRLERSLQEMKGERTILERRLLKVNTDIEDIFVQISECDQRLVALKDLREERSLEAIDRLNHLEEKLKAGKERKSKLLSIFESATPVLNMADLYVSPQNLLNMQKDIEELKLKQRLIEKNVAAQLEEREYLRTVASQVVGKVYDLERQVLKEKGENTWEAPVRMDPNCMQDIGGPNMWYCGTLTTDQLKRLIDEQLRKFRPAQDEEHPGTSESDKSVEREPEIDLALKLSSPL